jgi:hypothetical protein
LKQTVKCGICGKHLTGSCSYGHAGKYYYYHCFNKECPMHGKTISKHELENEFMNYLNEVSPKEDFLIAFKNTVLELWNRQGATLRNDAQIMKDSWIVLEEKRKRVFEMREDESYTTEEFKERIEEIEDQIMATKISLNETRIEQFDIEGSLSYANNFILNLGRQWMDLSVSRSSSKNDIS